MLKKVMQMMRKEDQRKEIRWKKRIHLHCFFDVGELAAQSAFLEEGDSLRSNGRSGSSAKYCRVHRRMIQGESE